MKTHVKKVESEGPGPKEVTEGPGWLRYATATTFKAIKAMRISKPQRALFTKVGLDLPELRV